MSLDVKSPRRSSEAPTPEQAGVIRSRARRIIVNACAGSGKTKTTSDYAIARPHERILYITFTASMARAAEGKFPSWVECRTIHSVAKWAILPALFGADHSRGLVDVSENKLGNMRPIEVARAMSISPRMARLIKETLNAWLCSADEQLTVSNIPVELSVPASQRVTVVNGANELFRRMCDRQDLAIKMPHDGYLKLWQLKHPDLSDRYDRIIVDEAQDLNSTIIDVLKRQKTGLLLVGDEFQAIYQFRGASNAMREIEVDERHVLSTSFRYGRGIAAVATALLATFRSLPHPIKGQGRFEETRFQIDRSRTYCSISRTNAALFDVAVRNLESGKPFHFIGGTEKYRFDAMMDVHYLMHGETGSIRDATLKHFSTMKELKDAAEDTDDRELKFLAKIAQNYGARIPALIEQLKKRHTAAQTPQTLQGGIVFTTAHGSKGLEFEQVSLSDDFFELTDDDGDIVAAEDVPDSELNLLYVAATRAERAIELNDGLRKFLQTVQRRAARQQAKNSAGSAQR